MNARTRVKICGLTREADVAAAVEAGADAIGFVLYAKSPRYVSVERVAALARKLPPFVTPVLLFVNAAPAEIAVATAAIPHALLQFHGDETPAACDAAARPYLRALHMASGLDLLDSAQRFPNAKGLLLDAPVEGYGGGGKVFDWSLVPQNLPAGVRSRLVLSGGLNPANVVDGVLHIRPCAVDVSSGVEQSKGIKDAALIRRFCEAVREADARLADSAT
ncbi:MAG: phosphoribosylanthranilate isomerase [Burkholderiaceae bacterium]|nr:phosphoribosylanthranilate isomerase [Burkholderiaceae bacterium]